MKLITTLALVAIFTVNVLAQHGKTFQRKVQMQTVDRKGNVTSTLTRESTFIFTDSGKPVELLIKGQGKLKGWKMTTEVWQRLCLDSSFQLNIPGVRWTCTLDGFKEFRGSEPKIIEIEPYH